MLKTLLSFLILPVIAGIFSIPVFADTIPVSYSLPFEDMPLGTLPFWTWVQVNGQSTLYTLGGDYQIINTGCVSGQCLKFNYGANIYIPDTTRGTAYYSFKRESASIGEDTTVWVWSTLGATAGSTFRGNGSIELLGNPIGTWVADTWYRIGVEWDMDTFRIKIDGGAWSDWVDSTALDGMQGMDLRREVFSSYDYVDNITINGYYDEPIIPPVLWSDTLVGSTTNDSIGSATQTATGALGVVLPLGIGVMSTTILLFRGLAWFKGIAGLKS